MLGTLKKHSLTKTKKWSKVVILLYLSGFVEISTYLTKSHFIGKMAVKWSPDVRLTYFFFLEVGLDVGYLLKKFRRPN